VRPGDVVEYRDRNGAARFGRVLKVGRKWVIVRTALGRRRRMRLSAVRLWEVK